MERFVVGYHDFGSLAQVAAGIIRFAFDTKIVTIQGELGAGKTTLVKEVCKYLGVSEPVSSPTFTLINEYPLDQDRIIYHIDLYRLEKESDAFELGLEEIFERDAWCFIEWPEKIASFLPEKFVSLMIEVDPVTNSRTISIRHSGA